MQKFTMKQLTERIKQLRDSGGADLSTEEDLSIAVMNLISLEEHFFFTAQKTGKDEYFDLLLETREIRKRLLAKMIPRHEGETWCVSKHLLAAAMRCIEVGTKLYSDGKKEDGRAMFSDAYQIYSLFWALRLKLTSVSELRKIDDTRLNIHDESSTHPWTKEEIVSKLVDCCNE